MQRKQNQTKRTCREDRRFRFQLSRIVSGETRTVSSDILIGVAKEFKVSTDYILGLSNISVRKSYDISELGLSEGAVKGLVTGAVDVQILNRLLEHRNFPKLIDLIRIYFQDTAAKGIMARTSLLKWQRLPCLI